MAAWARVLIAVCVLICCVRAATAEGAEFGRTGWRGRVNLRPQDRVGFLRFKKVGSTTVSTYLMNRTAVCINSCAAQGSKTKCVQQSCLYTTNCSSCAELRSPAVANRQFCYPCVPSNPTNIIGMPVFTPASVDPADATTSQFASCLSSLTCMRTSGGQHTAWNLPTPPISTSL